MAALSELFEFPEITASDSDQDAASSETKAEPVVEKIHIADDDESKVMDTAELDAITSELLNMSRAERAKDLINVSYFNTLNSNLY